MYTVSWASYDRVLIAQNLKAGNFHFHLNVATCRLRELPSSTVKCLWWCPACRLHTALSTQRRPIGMLQNESTGETAAISYSHLKKNKILQISLLGSLYRILPWPNGFPKYFKLRHSDTSWAFRRRYFHLLAPFPREGSYPLESE